MDHEQPEDQPQQGRGWRCGRGDTPRADHHKNKAHRTPGADAARTPPKRSARCAMVVASTSGRDPHQNTIHRQRSHRRARRTWCPGRTCQRRRAAVMVAVSLTIGDPAAAMVRQPPPERGADHPGDGNQLRAACRSAPPLIPDGLEVERPEWRVGAQEREIPEVEVPERECRCARDHGRAILALKGPGEGLIQGIRSRQSPTGGSLCRPRPDVRSARRDPGLRVIRPEDRRRDRSMSIRPCLVTFGVAWRRATGSGGGDPGPPPAHSRR